MPKKTIANKLTAATASTLMAPSSTMTSVAFAQTPSVDYTDGEGDNITKLRL